MGEIFNVRMGINNAFNNPNYDGMLEKEDIDEFERSDELIAGLSNDNSILSKLDGNGKYNEVDEETFNEFIYKIAEKNRIDSDSITDDINIMFKFLDENGDGILQSSELKKLDTGKTIDSNTLALFLYDLDKNTIQNELSLIKDIKNFDESDDAWIAAQHNVDINEIKEIRSGNYTTQSIPNFVDEVQITNYAKLFSVDSTVDDIIAKMKEHYPDEKPEDIEAVAQMIKNIVGIKTEKEDGSSWVTKYDINGKPTKLERYVDGKLESEWDEYVYTGKHYEPCKAIFYKDGEKVSSKEWLYDQDGRKIAEKLYNADDTLSISIERNYDRDGKLTKKNTVYYDQGNINYSNISTFKDGKEIKREEYNANGKLNLYLEYSYNAKGKEQERKYYNADGTLDRTIEKSYDENGKVNKITDVHYNNGEKEKTYIQNYDESGKVIKREDYNADGTLDRSIEYSYDENGKEIERKINNPDGTLNQTIEFKYDENGKLKTQEDIYYDEEGNKNNSSIHTFNENEKEIKREDYNADGTLDRTIEKSYDENGKVNKNTDVHYNNGEKEKTYIHNYDESGKEIKREDYNADGTLDRSIEYSYNENDKEIKRKIYNSDGTLNQTIEFKYDENGKLKTEEDIFYENKNKVGSNTFVFDEKGKVIDTTQFHANGKKYMNTKTKYDQDGSYRKEITYYNEDGSVKSTELKNYDKDGNEI